MFNRLFSLIGLSWGNGSMTVDGPSEPPSFPPFGTIIQNFPNLLRTVSQGGSSVTVSGSTYPNSVWNVNEVADGSGGTFLDWSNAIFGYYKSDFIANVGESSPAIIINGFNYGSGCSTSYDVYHDGNGGTYSDNYQGGCTTSGTYITNGSTPSYLTISGTQYQNGDIPIDYFHDGSGGYYSTSYSPNYYSYATHIVLTTGVPIYLTLYTNTGSQYVGQFQNGTKDVDYYHDGYGSYYGVDSNTMYTESGHITSYNFQTNVSGVLFNNGATAEFYFQPAWNGYYSIAEYMNYYSYGTYIWDDGYAFHYWDGNGGYYTNYNA